MSALGLTSHRLAMLSERGLQRGRESWRALQVGAAIAIGQVTSADDGPGLREPYPIVRVAEEDLDGFDRRERVGRSVLTAPLDLATSREERVGLPGDAPN